MKINSKLVPISIIVPVYNVKEYLNKCISSILNQTYSHFEVILVDDGSTDGSGEICDKFAKIDCRVKVIHKLNGGLSSARNVGIDNAQGELLCFIDSDDFIHSRFLEIMYERQVVDDADIVSTRYVTFYDQNENENLVVDILHKVLFTQDFINNLYPVNFEVIGVSAWGKLYKRHLFDCIRYPEGKIYEDLHIYVELLKKSRIISVVSPELYYYNVGNTSITKSNYLKYNRFDEFVIRLNHRKYFLDEGMEEQAEYALNDYLTYFFRNAFVVLLKYKEKRSELDPYMRQNFALLKPIVLSRKICRSRKAVSILIHFLPKVAFEIARKCIPECILPEQM